MRQFLIAIVALALCGLVTAEEPEDPYLWLEEVEGEEALDWVKDRSAKDTAIFEAVPVYAEIHENQPGDRNLLSHTIERTTHAEPESPTRTAV